MAGELSRKTAVKSGKKKKYARRKKEAGHALGVMILVVSLAASLLLVYFVLLVDKVEVQGSRSIDAESILTASGIAPGQHMFLLDEGAARAAILSNPYIESFEIVREYPDTVILRVKERVPRAVIADSAGESVLIDEKGAVLSIGAPPDEALVLVYGMGNAGYTLGQSIASDADFQATSLVAILDAVERAGLTGEVSSINMANALSIELSLRAGYLAKLGQPDGLVDKLMNLSSVLKQLKATGKTGGTIYLASRGGPVYSPEDEQENPPLPEDTGEPDPTGSPEPGASPSPTPEDEPFSG